MKHCNLRFPICDIQQQIANKLSYKNIICVLFFTICKKIGKTNMGEKKFVVRIFSVIKQLERCFLLWETPSPHEGLKYYYLHIESFPKLKRVCWKYKNKTGFIHNNCTLLCHLDHASQQFKCHQQSLINMQIVEI